MSTLLQINTITFRIFSHFCYDYWFCQLNVMRRNQSGFYEAFFEFGYGNETKRYNIKNSGDEAYMRSRIWDAITGLIGDTNKRYTWCRQDMSWLVSDHCICFLQRYNFCLGEINVVLLIMSKCCIADRNSWCYGYQRTIHTQTSSESTSHIPTTYHRTSQPRYDLYLAKLSVVINYIYNNTM